MKTILAAVDFSPVTDRVISEAIRLARTQRCRLDLIHVIAPPAAVDEFGAAVDVAREVTRAEEVADAHFVRIGRKLRGKFGHIEAACLKGAPAAQILQRQRECGASYIVIGSHGHTAVYDLLVGSTTYAVMQGAPCPVLVVPAGPAANKPPAGHRDASADLNTGRGAPAGQPA